MRKALFVAPLLAVIAFACSKSSSPSTATTQPAPSGGFFGTYTSTDASATFSSVTFYGDHLYFAYGATCEHTAAGCRTTGSYALGADGKSMTLTDAVTGVPQTLPLTIAASNATSTTAPANHAIRPQGLVGGGTSGDDDDDDDDASATTGNGGLISASDGGGLLVGVTISPTGLMVDGKPFNLITDNQGPALFCGAGTWCDLECAVQGGTSTVDAVSPDDSDTGDAGDSFDPLATGDDDDDSLDDASTGDDDDASTMGHRVIRRDAPRGTAACTRSTVAPPVVTGTNVSCDVIIAGGSTAAFTAALGAARENLTQSVCLIEPTDWEGGQLTSSAVPAIDWGDSQPWIAPNVYGTTVQKGPNLTASFSAALTSIKSAKAEGACWVGGDCFPSLSMLGFLRSLSIPNLTIFRNTVVKSVVTDTAKGQTYISSITAIRRKPVSGTGYDVMLDQDLPDWYSATASARFTKEVLTFSRAKVGFHPIVIDGTEWGELLALSHAPYMQGLEGTENPNDPTTHSDGDSACGQETVFDFVEKYSKNAAPENDMSNGQSYDFDTLKNLSCDLHYVNKVGIGHPCDWIDVFGYRRITGTNGDNVTRTDGTVGRRPSPADGDETIENWLNDEPSGYMFLSHQATDAQVGSWAGGVNLATLKSAEARSLAWHTWMRKQSGNRLVIDANALGTTSGLAKMPYVRDTRRSIGIGGFFLHMNDLSVAKGASTKTVGTNFHDSVATGLYKFDRHMVPGCASPNDAERAPVPYYIPFRALTNNGIANLLVTGKTMAQGFLANAATRLQPVEWATGEAAGIAASYMAFHGISDTTSAYQRVGEIQAEEAKRGVHTGWTLQGTSYPPSTDPNK